MGYFKELPEISYPSLLKKISKSNERINVKNLFRRAKLRADSSAFTIAQLYEIEDGERPEMLAEKLYGDPELDWVILTTNNIINIRDEWPLSNNALHNYALEKYGSEEKLLEVHHYETPRIVDEFDRIVLNEGLIVDSNFTFNYTINGNIIKTNAAGPVNNITYEIKNNNKKRIIQILKKEYLSAFVSDLKDIMTYKRSSDYISNTLKNTYNPRENGV